MDKFYEMLNYYLPMDYKCPGCGEQMWMQYGDGHIWYDCLNCDYEATDMLASYVTDYPVPKEPTPNNIEVRDKPEKYPYQLEHETKYYRRVVHPSPPTS